MSWFRPLSRPYIRPLHRIFFANQHPSVGTHYGPLWAQKGCVHTTVALQIMHIDYNQHWDSEYRPHRYAYSHICRLHNMPVIAQLIERSNNVGETVSRPPHALLCASSAPHTCHTILWVRRHPRRRLVRARGDRYDRCVRVDHNPGQAQCPLSRFATGSERTSPRRPVSQRGPVPPYRLGRPERSRPELPTAPNTQIRQVHKCGKKAMNKHRRDVSSPPTTVRIARPQPR